MSNDPIGGGLRKLLSEVEREGVDMAPISEFPVTSVLCPENRWVPEGFECPHTCKPGSCEGCPAMDAPE